MAQPYKRLQRLRSGKYEKLLTEDVLYWKRMKQLAIFQEPGIMTSTSFSPVEPYYVASTSSIRLSVFDTLICEPVTMYSRFKEAVYGVTFRNDGKLIAVGGHEGKVRLFDVQNQGVAGGAPKTPLRFYKAHTSPVHVVLFSCSGKQLLTMADDGSMKLFDIAENKSTPKRVINAAHSDRIRCGCASKFSSHLFVSGSYDHSAKVWDIRADEEERDAEDDEQDGKPLVSVEHDAPIEAVVLLNGDTILATAGGVAIKIWDIASGGRFLLALKHHHKTITSMCLASKGSRLISGGLDKKINIYHTDTPDYALIHSISLAAPVYAVAVSDDDQSMAVGMANLLAIFRRDPAGQHEQTLKEAKETGAGLEHSKTIRVAAPAPKERQRGGVTLDVELTAPLAPKIRLGKIDVLLRQYKHWKVVDVLFRNRHFWENNPDLVVAALTEIDSRQKLSFALAGRDSTTLRPLLQFLCRFMFHTIHFNILSKVARTLFEVYAAERVESGVVKYFCKLNDAIQRELTLQKSLYQTIGALDVLFAASRRQNSSVKPNEFFGDVIIQPLTLSMKEQQQQQKLKEGNSGNC